GPATWVGWHRHREVTSHAQGANPGIVDGKVGPASSRGQEETSDLLERRVLRRFLELFARHVHDLGWGRCRRLSGQAPVVGRPVLVGVQSCAGWVPAEADTAEPERLSQTEPVEVALRQVEQPGQGAEVEEADVT